MTEEQKLAAIVAAVAADQGVPAEAIRGRRRTREVLQARHLATALAYEFLPALTVPEIAAFVRARGFAKVELQEGDIESIVQTLVFDGRVDQARWPAAAPFFLILSQLFFFRPLSAARRSSSAPPGFSPCCSLPSKLKPCD